MPADPTEQLRALGNAFDELVPPVTMKDLRGRPSGVSRGRVAVRVFAAAAAVITLVAVGAIVLHRRGNDDGLRPVDTAPITDDLFVHHDPSSILVATPEAQSLTPEQMDGYNVVAADTAYSLPHGALAYQPIGDTAIHVRAADGSTTEVIAPPAGTHLRLYDAGVALGEPVIVYATVDEDEMESVVLHVVNADGTDDRTLGAIGFWEGWANSARLSGDVVTTEENTAGQGFVMRFDLATGEATNVTNETVTFPAESADGTVSARMDGDTLVVRQLSGGETRVPLPFEVGFLVSLEPGTNDVILNRWDAPAIVMSDIRSEQPIFAPVPFAGTASFIESPPTAVPDEELAAALATWSESGPSEYLLSLSVVPTQMAIGPKECEFAVSSSGSTLVRGPIRVDTAAGTRAIDSYLGFCSSFVPSTVEGLLQLIAEHRAEGHDVPATFADSGVPVEFTLDADMDETDGASHYTVTVSDPLVLPTVTLTARGNRSCGPTGGAWVVASGTS
ncbi:MAG: hypothetical protein ABMA25_21520, partial [Ilumatobacteraceae bacterium]